MIKILLTDDYPKIIRDGLKTLIQSHIPDSIIEEACDGNSAFEKIKNNEYQLIVLDIHMPITDSIGLVNDIFMIKPYSKILIFSMNTEKEYAQKYLQLGVMGYLTRDAAEMEIRSAIDNILNNKKYLSASLIESLTEEVLNKKSNPFSNLSPREFEIAQHLISGETVGKISDKLQLHASTVGTHKARILEKLNCRNMIEINSLAKVHRIQHDKPGSNS